MIKVTVKSLADPCPSCADGRDVGFAYSGEAISLLGVSYHHEYTDLLEFAAQLRVLEERRTGSATLTSPALDSEFRLSFYRKGGQLCYCAKHLIRHNSDDDAFDESVSYFGAISSEDTGRFLAGLIGEIERANQSVETNAPPGEQSR